MSRCVTDVPIGSGLRKRIDPTAQPRSRSLVGGNLLESGNDVPGFDRHVCVVEVREDIELLGSKAEASLFRGFRRISDTMTDLFEPIKTLPEWRR
jgi:hypothetical protein